MHVVSFITYFLPTTAAECHSLGHALSDGVRWGPILKEPLTEKIYFTPGTLVDLTLTIQSKLRCGSIRIVKVSRNYIYHRPQTWDAGHPALVSVGVYYWFADFGFTPPIPTQVCLTVHIPVNILQLFETLNTEWSTFDNGFIRGWGNDSIIYERCPVGRQPLEIQWSGDADGWAERRLKRISKELGWCGGEEESGKETRRRERRRRRSNES